MNSRLASSSAAFAPYRGERDYRAVLFTCAKLQNIEAVAQLFEGRPLGKTEQRGLTALGTRNVSGTRVRYRSENCFLRTANIQSKNALLATDSTSDAPIYEYEVCVLAQTKEKPPVFLVAVPFAGMAREFFGKIHDRKPSADFRYLRPSLDEFIAALLARREGLERLRTVGINWTIAGETGFSEQITIRGQDLIDSHVFTYLRDPKAKLSLSLRKVQIVHEGFGGSEKLKLTFDKFGNYAVWTAEEAGNLPDVFNVLELLQAHHLIREETAFPVRDREEKPLLP